MRRAGASRAFFPPPGSEAEALRSAVPSIVPAAPMLARAYAGELPAAGAFSQPKLDGVRVVASRAGLFSRNGQRFSLPSLSAALRPMLDASPNLVLDGEIYAHGSRIELIAGKVRAGDDRGLALHLFDIASHPGNFGERWRVLLDLSRACRFGRRLELVETQKIASAREADDLYSRYLADGYEGQMIRLDMPYSAGRSTALLKRKEFVDSEFDFVRFESGRASERHHALSVICRSTNGREFGATIAGSQDDAFRRSKRPSGYREVTVRYFGLTSQGVPRFPVAVAFHSEKRTI